MDAVSKIDLTNFSKNIARIFNEDISINLKYDTICMLICENLLASQVSILLYDGREDKIICNGNFINPHRSISISSGDVIIKQMLERVGIIDYLESEKHDLPSFNDFEKSIFNFYSTSDLFENTKNELSSYKVAYTNYKNINRREKHGVNDNTITGKFYKKLFDSGEEPQNTVEVIRLKEPNEKIIYSSLVKGLDIKVDKDGYYLGLPLFANGRYFGILRIIFSDKLGFYDNKQAEIDSLFNERLLFIAQLTSLQIENNYYLEGYKKLNLIEIKINNLNNFCNQLCSIINCNGVFISLMNNQINQLEIKGYSQNIAIYLKKIEIIQANKSINYSFNDEIIEIFNINDEEEDKTEAIMLKVDTFGYNKNYSIQKYQFERGGLRQKQVNKKNDSFTYNYFKVLNDSNIGYITIIPIPYIDSKSFMLFTNTKNRNFTNDDIEMILSGVKNFGLELSHFEDREKIKKQEHAIALADGMATVIHQVGSPINAIRGQLLNLARGITSFEMMPRKANAMVLQVNLALAQLNSFQRILDLDTKPIEVKKKRINNLSRYLISKSIAYNQLANSKGIGINVTTNGNYESIETDEKLLDEVINILLDNAVKYSFKPQELIVNKINFDYTNPKSDGHIQINIQNLMDKSIIKVINWGCTIQNDEKEKIFERGYRGKNANDFSTLGSGIGLYIVKKIITAMYGKIELINEKNKTTFVIILKKN